MAYFGLQNNWVPFAFLTGGFFSALAGFFGMKTATYASARTANAAKNSLNKGLQVAFRSGAVMGLVVVGLALLDISAWYLVLNHFIDNALAKEVDVFRAYDRKRQDGNDIFLLRPEGLVRGTDAKKTDQPLA
jgi:Na+/H+-translocating membrane pyrophosphatase